MSTSRTNVRPSEPAKANALSWAPVLLGLLLAVIGLVLFGLTVAGWMKSSAELAATRAKLIDGGKLLTQKTADLAIQEQRVKEKTGEVESLMKAISVEREARGKDARELEALRARKAEAERAVAELADVKFERDEAMAERDAARQVAGEVVAVKQGLEEQVSVLQQRLDGAIARITDLERQLRRAVAERDEMADMVRVAKTKADEQVRLAAKAREDEAAIAAARAVKAEVDSPVAPVPGRSTTVTASTPTTALAGPGVRAVDGTAAVVPAPVKNTPTPANNAVTVPVGKRVTDATVVASTPTAGLGVVTEGEGNSPRGPYPAVDPVLQAKASESKLRVTGVGRNLGEKSIGLFGVIPDFLGNVVVGVGEGLDSLFNGTHYVPEELIPADDQFGR